MKKSRTQKMEAEWKRINERINQIYQELKGIDLDTDEAVNLSGELDDLEIKLDLIDEWLTPCPDHGSIYGEPVIGRTHS